ncbi:MAG: hypothetical protein B7Z55_03525, partial [Planctomycetales bacterium 12-60-4]
MHVTTNLLTMVACLTVANFGWAQTGNVKAAFLSAQDAGPDYVVQGEYAGKVGDAQYGAQVI